MSPLRLRYCSSLTFLSFIIAVTLGCASIEGAPLLREADEHTQAKDFDRAIAAYQQHIEERRADTQRPEWENPYFYLLSIGDLELERGNFDKALQSYEEAERQGVEAPLVADRYRAVATSHEDNGRLTDAIAVLTKYRDRDPLIFDSMLDRIARRLTEEESVGSRTSVAKSPSRTPINPK